MTTNKLIMPLRRPFPRIPWAPLDDLPREDERQAYGTCEKDEQERCIVSKLIIGFGKLQNRRIRQISTRDAGTYWSEYVPKFKRWARFFAPFRNKTFVKSINNFDEKSHHFIPPEICPYGTTQFVEWCREHLETPEQRSIQAATHEENIRKGTVQRRKTKRDPLFVAEII